MENLDGDNDVEGGKGSVNYLRHARVSEAVNKWDKERKKPNANKERIRQEAIELSRRMKHSTEQQKKYVRNLDTKIYFWEKWLKVIRGTLPYKFQYNIAYNSSG